MEKPRLTAKNNSWNYLLEFSIQNTFSESVNIYKIYKMYLLFQYTYKIKNRITLKYDLKFEIFEIKIEIV